MNALSPWHLVILVLVVVVLFGAKRLPDAARSIGKSMKIFKAETKDMRSASDGADAADARDAASGPDARQLPQPGATAAPEAAADPAAAQSGAVPSAGTDEQVEQLQRQLDELRRQQAEQGGAGQAQAQRNHG